MKDVITQHLGELLTGLVALILGWLGKGKIQKNQDNADLTKKIQSIYKDLIADTELKIEAQEVEIEALKKRQKEIDDNWKKKIASVERKWQTKYANLKKQFDNYKKIHP